MKLKSLALPTVILLALAAPAAAQYDQHGAAPPQTAVTTADIQRLQDQVYDASNEISRLRSRDQASADRLQSRLDDARDDVTYLRVKLRRQGSVGRDEYMDVRHEVESIRGDTRAAASSGSQSGSPTRQGSSTWSTGQSSANDGSGAAGGTTSGVYGGTASSGSNPARQPRRNEVPAGTELDVRLERALNSGAAQVEDRFTATTLADLYQGNDVLIPAGSTLRGVVSSVTKATRTERKGALTVAFDQITVNGRVYPIHATVSQALESEGIRGEVGKIGAGAGVGAILGGILGGGKGALLGVLIGGGGTIAATEGKDVDLPVGTILRVRMEQPLLIR
jgi:TolA-binding protein